MPRKRNRRGTLRLPKDPFKLPPPPVPLDPLIDPPLAVRYVNYWDWEQLCFNLASAFIAWAFMALIIYARVIKEVRSAAGTSALIVWTIIMIAAYHGKFWTTVDKLKAKVYLDYFDRSLSALTQGGNFIAWSASEQDDDIDFQRHVIISFCKKDKTALEIECMDGFNIVIEVTVFFNILDHNGEYLGRTLKYTFEEIKAFVTAAIKSRLAEYAGVNGYEVLLANKGIMALWLATTFGGEETLSDFEKSLGISIRNPILDSLDLTEESKAVFAAKSTMQQLSDGIKMFKKTRIPAKECSFLAQLALRLTTRQIQTFELPKQIRTLAVGEGTGVAVGSNENN